MAQLQLYRFHFTNGGTLALGGVSSNGRTSINPAQAATLTLIQTEPSQEQRLSPYRYRQYRAVDASPAIFTIQWVTTPNSK
jgi:hypothetical protein